MRAWILVFLIVFVFLRFMREVEKVNVAPADRREVQQHLERSDPPDYLL